MIGHRPRKALIRLIHIEPRKGDASFCTAVLAG